MPSPSTPTFGEGNDDPNISNSSLPIPRDHRELNKRKLLLIYIHGFMGSEASFLRFPDHVHGALMTFLGDTHIIYTRIYPKYQCRGEMTHAVEQFSTWLSPHEADDLDVILLGHSIGGALAAGVTLLPDLADMRHHSKKHRIMGLVNFDVPFLGLHPCVISSGIRSLFKKSDVVNAVVPGKNRGSEEMDASYFPIVTNPNFDPCFGNDVRLPEHSRLQGAIDFFDKNICHLPGSIFDSVISFYKFPGYLNRLPHLRRRYQEMMNLEATKSGIDRVRFVNYYTESNGHKSTSEHRTKKHGYHNCHKDDVNESCNSSSISVISALTATSERPMKHAVTSGSKELGGKPRPEVKVGERKPRTFVLKPSHHWDDGDNHLWRPVQMNGMDEVEAHQSMFLPHGKEYDKLVGDTVSTIEHWVQDAMSASVIEMEKTTSSR